MKIFSDFSAKNIWSIQKNILPLQPQTRNNGAIAQLVEQRTENPCVPGSIPGGTTCKSSYSNVAAFFFSDISVNVAKKYDNE